MHWFGPNTARAPFDVTDLRRAPIPTGEACGWCQEAIGTDDFGVLMGCVQLGTPPKVTLVAYHWECHARMVIGSVAHLEGRCSCAVPGSICTDPPEMSKRDAARAAVRSYRQRLGGPLH